MFHIVDHFSLILHVFERSQGRQVSVKAGITSGARCGRNKSGALSRDWFYARKGSK